MTARGVVAALVAVSAGLPFYPIWAAPAIGAVAGLLVPLAHFVIDRLLRLDDPTAIVATHGVPALWGLLAVGLFADGHAGQGWNQAAGGQGVAGLWVVEGVLSDWPGQFIAQGVGAAAVLLCGFFLYWLLYSAVQGLSRAWQGEYTLRLPKKIRAPARRRPALRSRLPRVQVVYQEAEDPVADASYAALSWWQRALDRVRVWMARWEARRPAPAPEGEERAAVDPQVGGEE
jgi:hypothetical protein